MPQDGHYSHSVRLGTPANQYQRTSSSHLNAILLDDSSTSGPSLDRIIGRTNVHSIPGTSSRGARIGYNFPETFDDPEVLQAQKDAFLEVVQGSQRSLRFPWYEAQEGQQQSSYGWDQEDIHVPQRHLPAPETDDVLPSEAHSSYPFGRPYLRPSGQQHRASTLKHTHRPWLSEANQWNGIGASSNASTSGRVGGGTREALSKPLTSLPPYLVKKQALNSIPHPTSSWPFRPSGPGPILNWKSILSTRQTDSPQDDSSLLSKPAWFELGLEELLPRGKEANPLTLKRKRKNSSALSGPEEELIAACEEALIAQYGPNDDDFDDDENEEEGSDDEEKDNPQEDDAEMEVMGNKAEERATRQVNRAFLHTGTGGDRRQSSSSGAVLSRSDHTDELRKLLASMRLKSANAGTSHLGRSAGGGSVFLQRARRAREAQSV
ncbi:unnamed protein product [Sympodiomycopsis kandeliae]